MSIVQRIYQRFTPDVSIGMGGNYHSYFMDALARTQWSKDKCRYTPAIYSEKSKDEFAHWPMASQIRAAHHYYMHPFVIHYFVSDMDKFETKPNLVTRAWLSRINDVNHTFVMMDRMSDKSLYEYLDIIGTNDWRPKDWQNITKANNLTQTIIDNKLESIKLM